MGNNYNKILPILKVWLNVQHCFLPYHKYDVDFVFPHKSPASY